MGMTGDILRNKKIKSHGSRGMGGKTLSQTQTPSYSGASKREQAVHTTKGFVQRVLSPESVLMKNTYNIRLVFLVIFSVMRSTSLASFQLGHTQQPRVSTTARNSTTTTIKPAGGWDHHFCIKYSMQYKSSRKICHGHPKNEALHSSKIAQGLHCTGRAPCIFFRGTIYRRYRPHANHLLQTVPPN